jgi:pimeloyl-ACP methyl ester carboxylesterase
VVVSGLLASSGFVIETMKRVNPMPAPGRFVELEDAEGNAVNVHYQYYGDGDVTVVFDGGVGETSFDWDKVTQQVAKFASVLAIDRPGLGFSTATMSPRTASQIASEYASVLDHLQIKGSVLLVAHGAGGYNMR